MKKALLTLAVAVMALTMGAQAQESGKINDHKWVIGGTGRLIRSTVFTDDVSSVTYYTYSDGTTGRE